MNETRNPLTKSLHRLQGLSALAAVIIAAVIAIGNHHHRQAVAEQIHARHYLKLVAAKDRMNDYFSQIHLCLQLMSRYPYVMDDSKLSDEYLRAIYEANYSHHYLEEVYIHKLDFDASSRPYKTFEHERTGYGKSKPDSVEREPAEYNVQLDQMGRFQSDPTLDFLISAPIDLRVGEPGRVFSVPVRSNGKLLGIVSGMVTDHVISEKLEGSSPPVNALILARKNASFDVCTDFPEEMKTWFQRRFQEEGGVEAFFEHRPPSFQAGRYTAFWMPAEIEGDRNWYVGLIYDDKSAMASVGISSAWSGWGTAGMVLLLGGVVVVLCRAVLTTINTRQKSDERAEALRESEGRLRSIVDTAAEAIITCDEKGIIESFNTSAEKLFGWKPHEIIGKNVGLLASSPHAENHDAYMQRYLETNQPRIIGVGREVIARRKDGSRFPINLAVSEVRLKGRRIFTGIIGDESERKLAQETIRRHNEILEQTVKERTAELAAAKQKAEDSSRAKSAFLANMSHELRTPLHGILSFAEFGLQQHGRTSSEEQEENFRMIRQSGKTLLALLNDVLDLAKLESGGMTFELETVDLAVLIRSVMEEFKALASQRRLIIRCSDRDCPSLCEVDPVKIKQVIRNLLSNAVKFSPANGVIDIHTYGEKESVLISISDQGPGIPEKELETVFEKFVQSSKTVTGAGGTGLGLAICRQMVTAQGGRIWAENNPDGGATLSFTFPTRRHKKPNRRRNSIVRQRIENPLKQ